MNTANHVPTIANPSAPGICQRMLKQIAVKLMVAFLLAPGLIGSARAVEQPPETAPQQRAWLLSHLVTDMQSVRTLQSNDIAQMVTLVNSLTDDQVNLLTRFYFLTREKTEQDAQLYAVQQTDTGDALAQAKAQVADLLTQLQNQIQQTYSELATINHGCETLCQVQYPVQVIENGRDDHRNAPSSGNRIVVARTQEGKGGRAFPRGAVIHIYPDQRLFGERRPLAPCSGFRLARVIPFDLGPLHWTTPLPWVLRV